MSKLYRIPKLEWKDYSDHSLAESPFGRWMVAEVSMSVFKGGRQLVVSNSRYGEICAKPTRKEAKAAAQAAYDTKMAEGLVEDNCGGELHGEPIIASCDRQPKKDPADIIIALKKENAAMKAVLESVVESAGIIGMGDVEEIKKLLEAMKHGN